MEDLPRLVHAMHYQPPDNLEVSAIIAKLLAHYCSSFSLNDKKRSVLDELEKVANKRSFIKIYKGNQVLASDFLGISRSTFHTKVKRYQIDVDEF